MSETKTAGKPPIKSLGLLGAGIASLITTFFVAVAAWCFLSAFLGFRSLHQHGVVVALHQIDSLLRVQTWISPPGWIHQINDFYAHWRTVALQPLGDCSFSPLSSLSQALLHFQEASSTSAANNPIAKEFSQTCSVIKTQILPLLSGAVAVVVTRLWILITAFPLFLLSLSVGLIDGLVQRDIRKFQGKRESALLFHRIKRGGAAIFFLPLLAYLAWLSPVSSLWFLAPMAISIGLWLALSLRFFKKYV